MAYGNYKEKQKPHAFQTIAKDLKEDRIGNPVLLYGKEQYLVQWACGEIVNKYVNPACAALDYTELEGSETTVDEIIETCETLTMFSEKRVVSVRNFPPLEGGRMKNFGENEEKKLAEYIKNLPPSCILIFRGEKTDRRLKLTKACEASGAYYDFGPLDEPQLRGLIIKRFNAYEKAIRQNVIEELILNTGYYHKETNYTLFNLENDIKKIVAHAQGNEVTLSDVLTTVSGNLETNVFGMVDAISRNRKDEAYRLLFNLVNAGENFFMILGSIVSQFEIILEVKELRHEGKNLSQMSSILNVHEFRIKKAMGFAERYSVENLRKILKAAYSVDRNLKQGLLEKDLCLEMFIASL
ncbi:MAG: DNA polymerase III subunit delta [Clostridia bacterium]|nr:DNA polymerase III subunit delta [Clostridia bacterium]